MYSKSENFDFSPHLSLGEEHAQEAAEGGLSSLDIRTQLGIFSVDVEQHFGWMFSLWGECAEASLVWLPERSKAYKRVRPRLLDADCHPIPDGAQEQPEPWYRSPENDLYEGESQRMVEHLALLGLLKESRADLHWRIANGRAASKSRRYFVRNQLRYMWVLTFAESVTDRRSVMSIVSEFARRLRLALGGVKFAYWYSPELHPGGHGWHVNFFINRRVQHDLFVSTWGFGFVWVTDFASSPKGPKGEPLGLCRSAREGWRRAAQYGCKYSQKDWSPEHVGRSNHRYEIAQGFAPQRQRQWMDGPREAWNAVAELVPNGEWNNLRYWDSNDAEDWSRTPVRVWQW